MFLFWFKFLSLVIVGRPVFFHSLFVLIPPPQRISATGPVERTSTHKGGGVRAFDTSVCVLNTRSRGPPILSRPSQQRDICKDPPPQDLFSPSSGVFSLLVLSIHVPGDVWTWSVSLFPSTPQGFYFQGPGLLGTFFPYEFTRVLSDRQPFFF